MAKALNELKGRGTFRDWAIFGAVAFIAHEEPIHTRDMDILVLVDSEDDFRQIVVPSIARLGERDPDKGDTFRIDGVPLQVISTAEHPLLVDTVTGAVVGKIGDQRVRIASREHLIVLGLIRFWPKDWGRIADLYKRADRRKLAALLERFDETGELKQRLDTFDPTV